MKTNFTKTAMIVTVSLFTEAYSQNSDESQLRSLNTAYPAAVLANDVNFLKICWHRIMYLITAVGPLKTVMLF